MSESVRRKRTNISEIDTALLIDLINSEGFAKIINSTSKSVTRQQRTDCWTRLTKKFNELAGKDFEEIHVKSLWGRIKKDKKDKHDALKIFKRQCALTGGGPSPDIPEEIDGDLGGLIQDDLDPTETPYNSLVTPEDKFNKRRSLKENQYSDGMKAIRPTSSKIISPRKLNLGFGSSIVESEEEFSPPFKRRTPRVLNANIGSDRQRIFPPQSTSIYGPKISNDCQMVQDVGTFNVECLGPKDVLIVDSKGNQMKTRIDNSTYNKNINGMKAKGPTSSKLISTKKSNLGFCSNLGGEEEFSPPFKRGATGDLNDDVCSLRQHSFAPQSTSLIKPNISFDSQMDQDVRTINVESKGPKDVFIFDSTGNQLKTGVDDSICNKSIEGISTDPARVEQISTKKLKDRITKKNSSEHGRGEHITSKKMNDGAYSYFASMEDIQNKLYEKKMEVLDQQLKAWKKMEKADELRALYYKRKMHEYSSSSSHENDDKELSDYSKA